jgi:hypothetical protein
MTSEAPNLHRDAEAAAEMAVNAVLKYLHECDIEGEKQKRQWIQSVFDRVISKELSN